MGVSGNGKHSEFLSATPIIGGIEGIAGSVEIDHSVVSEFCPRGIALSSHVVAIAGLVGPGIDRTPHTVSGVGGSIPVEVGGIIPHFEAFQA